MLRLTCLCLALVVSSAWGQPRAEARLHHLQSVDCAELFGPGVYEASGLALANGRLHMVFDNLAQVGSVGLDLDPAGATLSQGRAGFSDYEGIVFDPEWRCYYVAVEAQGTEAEGFYPRVVRLDEQGTRTAEWRVERRLSHGNKGAEGLCLLRRGGETYLLVLLEGNHGSGGDRGRQAGHGRLVVLRATPSGEWTLERELALPKTAAFVDYAGIDVRGEQVAIVSQSSAALWVGELAADWSLSDGQVIPFPRQDDGSKRYARVEGVVWLSATRLAMCSDQERPRDRGKGRAEQALHVFELLQTSPSPGVADPDGGISGRVRGD